jgi:ankyrin repeat protein
MAISYRAAQTLIKRGDEPALRVALEGGLSPDATNQNGWTLLMLAAVEGSLPIGQLLLEKGANFAAMNLKGDTALSIAQQKSHDEFVGMLKSL